MSNRLTLASVILAHVFVIAGLTFVGGCKSTGPGSASPATENRRAFSGFSGPGESGASGNMATTTVAQPAPAPAPAPSEQPTHPASPVVENTGTTTTAAAPAPAPEPADVAPAPAAEPKTSEPKAAGAGRTYVVKKNESLWIIAKREGVSVAELTEANGLKKNTTLREGQKLTIPASSGRKASSDTTVGSAHESHKSSVAVSGDTYVVKSGDSLSTVAKKLGTTSAALREANGIKGDAIRVGQKLKVPSGSKSKVASSSDAATTKSPAVKTASTAPAAKTGSTAGVSSSGLKDVPMFGQPAPAPAPADAAAPAPAPAPAPEAVDAVPVSK